MPTSKTVVAWPPAPIPSLTVVTNAREAVSAILAIYLAIIAALRPHPVVASTITITIR